VVRTVCRDGVSIINKLPDDVQGGVSIINKLYFNVRLRVTR